MRLIAILLAAALWILSALAWPRLPREIPRHIDAQGSVTWTATTPGSWFMMPAIATAAVLLMALVRRAARRRPALLNIPGKEELMTLPPERQAPVLDRAIEMIDGTAVVMMLIFGAVQLGIWRAAHGGSADSVLVIVLPLAVLSTPLVLGVWLPRISNELERQVKAHRAADR